MLPKFISVIQGVHKVLIQFQKFFMKLILKISSPGWFSFKQCYLKFLLKINFCIQDMIFMCFMTVLIKPILNGYSSRKGTMCILVH